MGKKGNWQHAAHYITDIFQLGGFGCCQVIKDDKSREKVKFVLNSKTTPLYEIEITFHPGDTRNSYIISLRASANRKIFRKPPGKLFAFYLFDSKDKAGLGILGNPGSDAFAAYDLLWVLAEKGSSQAREVLERQEYNLSIWRPNDSLDGTLRSLHFSFDEILGVNYKNYKDYPTGGFKISAS
ncbi:MAG: hypothetical protein CEN90_747 [Parcubacteria group bacterium Licking1014_17]|nr:MAG: hypothetical protein CEN90_747 [Parcubacteria group bacterium Licking1014_17]